MNLEQAAQAAKFLLTAIGEDVNREGLRETPRRVAMAYAEMTRGYSQDPKAILSKCFDVAYDEMVVLRDVHFVSLCEHHLLPFTGVAHVGYLPSAKVVGLSKMARLVHCFAKRLQVQERMTRQIADAMDANLAPKGVAVVVKAHHACMSCRGIKEEHAQMVTSAMLGSMRVGPPRAEFLRLIGL